MKHILMSLIILATFSSNAQTLNNIKYPDTKYPVKLSAKLPEVVKVDSSTEVSEKLTNEHLVGLNNARFYDIPSNMNNENIISRIPMGKSDSYKINTTRITPAIKPNRYQIEGFIDDIPVRAEFKTKNKLTSIYQYSESKLGITVVIELSADFENLNLTYSEFTDISKHTETTTITLPSCNKQKNVIYKNFKLHLNCIPD